MIRSLLRISTFLISVLISTTTGKTASRTNDEEICREFGAVLKGVDPKLADIQDPSVSLEIFPADFGPKNLLTISMVFDFMPDEAFLGETTTNPSINGKFVAEDEGTTSVSCKLFLDQQQTPNSNKQLIHFDNDAIKKIAHRRLGPKEDKFLFTVKWSPSDIPVDGNVIISAYWRRGGTWFAKQSSPHPIIGNHFADRKAAFMMANYEAPPRRGSRNTLAIVPDKSLDGFYAGCEVTQGCVGCSAVGVCTGKASQGCLAAKNCQIIVNYQWQKSVVQFSLMAKQVPLQGWISVGISKDENMGGDSVVLCKTAQTRSSLNISVDAYWNSGKTTPTLLDPSPAGVVIDPNGRYENGDMYCSFSQSVQTTVASNKFDLYKESYFVLLAAGPIRNDGTLAIHTVRGAPGSAVNLTSVEGADLTGEALELAHGVLMIFAWVAAASSGMLAARYYKRTWVASTLLGKAVWFTIHRGLMALTWILTIVSFLIIVIKEQGFEKGYHPTIGIIVLVLTFIQPFLAAIRCSPNNPKRIWFNWSHWLIGSLAHILACVNIFLAFDLWQASEIGYYIFGAFVIFYCLSHVGLQFQRYMIEKSERNSTSPVVDGKSDYDLLASKEASGSGLRRMMFGLTIVVNVGVSIALCLVFSRSIGGEPLTEWTDAT